MTGGVGNCPARQKEGVLSVATKTAIARMEGDALDRLRAAMAQAADAGVEPVAVPTHGRDAAFLRAAQLAAFATWAENAVTALAAAHGAMVGRAADLDDAPDVTETVITVDASDELEADDPPTRSTRQRKTKREDA